MPKEELTPSLILIVKWEQYPFAIPYDADQEKDNLIWAQNETMRILAPVIDAHPEIQVLKGYKDNIRLIIPEPGLETSSGRALWLDLFDVLKEQDKVSSVFVYVIDGFSETIARSLADTVQQPWHTGYKGLKKPTAIYHK